MLVSASRADMSLWIKASVNVPGCPNQGKPWKTHNPISQISCTFSRECHALWLLNVVAHLLGLICTKFKTTADNVNKIPNQSVKQVCVKKKKSLWMFGYDLSCCCCCSCSQKSLHAHINNTFCELDNMLDNIENDFTIKKKNIYI